MIEALGDQRGKAHKKSVCALLAHRRYLKQKKNGALVIDRAKIEEEERFDGKYILSTSDDSLSPEDVALGYKQLLEVERAFRTLKTTLGLRPPYHHKDERIASHVFSGPPSCQDRRAENGHHLGQDQDQYGASSSRGVFFKRWPDFAVHGTNAGTAQHTETT